MSNRISFGKNTPLSFRENLQFDEYSPYKIRCKEFVNDDIAPLHYADAMEILICCRIIGEIVIENKRIAVDGNAVVLIPPGAVHSVTIHKGTGRAYVLHVSFTELRGVMDVPTLMKQSGLTLAGIDYVCPEFERVLVLINEMIERDDAPFARTRALLEIFEILSKQMRPCVTSDRLQTTRGREELRRILRWTEQNFINPVRLEQAAAAVGFTKNYFCSWFKTNTGITYNHYLNNVRISNACRVLTKTGSIADACYESGFRDMSYFIQLFKKTQGCTPKAYADRIMKRSDGTPSR